MATGRSDYPNQINNVLCFPGFFRGAARQSRAHRQRRDEGRGGPRHRRCVRRRRAERGVHHPQRLQQDGGAGGGPRAWPGPPGRRARPDGGGASTSPLCSDRVAPPCPSSSPPSTRLPGCRRTWPSRRLPRGRAASPTRWSSSTMARPMAPRTACAAVAAGRPAVTRAAARPATGARARRGAGRHGWRPSGASALHGRRRGHADRRARSASEPALAAGADIAIGSRALVDPAVRSARSARIAAAGRVFNRLVRRLGLPASPTRSAASRPSRRGGRRGAVRRARDHGLRLRRRAPAAGPAPRLSRRRGRGELGRPAGQQGGVLSRRARACCCRSAARAPASSAAMSLRRGARGDRAVPGRRGRPSAPRSSSSRAWTSCTWSTASPTSRRPPSSSRPGRGARGRPDALHAQPRASCRCARRSPSTTGRRYGVKVSPEQILVTPGTSPAMLLLFGALLDPRRRGRAERSLLRLLSELRPLRRGRAGLRGHDRGGRLPVPAGGDRPRLAPRTRAILINSPANPTGAVLSAERMAASPRWPRARALVVVSDEIYHGLTYEGPRALDPGVHRPGLRAERVLQGLRDDRLAAGLPHRAAPVTRARCSGSTATSSSRPTSSSSGPGVAALREAADGARALPAHLRRAAAGRWSTACAGIGLGVGARADRGVLRAGQRPALHERLARASRSRSWSAPRGGDAGRGLRPQRRGLPALLLRGVARADPGGAAAARRASWPRADDRPGVRVCGLYGGAGARSASRTRLVARLSCTRISSSRAGCCWCSSATPPSSSSSSAGRARGACSRR